MENNNTVLKEKATIIVHSGDFDKLYSALIIGNGALSMGMEATIFFTFWGLLRLKKGGLDKGELSKKNLFGFGKLLINFLMKRKNVAPLEKLISDFKELGGKILACDMTMGIMGIKKKDLRQDLVDDYVGVGAYIQEAKESKITLFI